MKRLVPQHPDLSGTLDLLPLGLQPFPLEQIQRPQTDDHPCEMPACDHEERHLALLERVKRGGGRHGRELEGAQGGEEG